MTATTTTAEMFESISEAIYERSGRHFTLDDLEALLSGFPIDCDAYDLKAVRSAIGYPTNWGSFEFVFNWGGNGEDLASVFNSNLLRTVYFVACGELRNICQGDRRNETPIWRPCYGSSRFVGRFDSVEQARKVFDDTDPMDEWFESVSDKTHAVYVELYEKQYTARGEEYGTGRIDEKVFYLTANGRVA